MADNPTTRERKTAALNARNCEDFARVACFVAVEDERVFDDDVADDGVAD